MTDRQTLIQETARQIALRDTLQATLDSGAMTGLWDTIRTYNRFCRARVQVPLTRSELDALLVALQLLAALTGDVPWPEQRPLHVEMLRRLGGPDAHPATEFALAEPEPPQFLMD